MSGNVYIRCDAASNDCGYFKIHTEDISGSLTVDCMNEYNCGINDTYDPYDASYLNVQCQCAYIHCNDNSLGSSPLVYNSLSLKWECSSYCPWERREIPCIAGESCKIDCGGDSCIGYNIDVSLATSLTLNCTDSRSCDGVKVECPTVSNGSCMIHCHNYASCRYAYIIAGDNNTMNALDLQCEGSYGCYQMYIEATASMITAINLSCTGQYGCYGMQLRTEADITNVDIHCKDFGCESANFSSLGTADSVVLDYNVQGCRYAQFFGPANDLSIHCTGNQSCAYAQFNGTTLTTISPAPTQSQTDTIAAASGTDPGETANATNVLSAFISFLVVIAMVTSF